MATLSDCLAKIKANLNTNNSDISVLKTDIVNKVDKNSDATFNTITVSNQANLNGNTIVGKNFKVNGFYVATARDDSAWYDESIGDRGYQLCSHHLGETPDLNGVEFRVVNPGSGQMTSWSGSLMVGDNSDQARPWYGGYSNGIASGYKQLAST